MRPLRLGSEESLGRREQGEELGLGDQELRQEIAARAHADEPGEELGAPREQLDEPGARARRREEALELVERLVGVGALPERVEEHRAEALERRAKPARVWHERTPLEDQREVVARPLGVDEAGRAERHRSEEHTSELQS